MNRAKIPARIAHGLAVIREQAVKLDTARVEGHAYDAKIALKTIKDECAHLRQFVGQLSADAGEHAGSA